MSKIQEMNKLNIISISFFVLLLQFNAFSQIWDERPALTLETQYQQDFTTGSWNETAFYNQWETMIPGSFTASDIASGYLQFVWSEKRVIATHNIYSAPYSFEAKIDYSAGSSRGGLVIRAIPATDIDVMQQAPKGDPGFNSEGIAFFPSDDGSSLMVQFTGVYVNNNTAFTRIAVPAPASVPNLRAGAIIMRVEDYGSSIYVFINDNPAARIELTSNLYTSGIVYSSDMSVAGTFSGMEVEKVGRLSVAQRDASLRLFNVEIKGKNLEKQTIAFNSIGKKCITDAPFDLEASASSGLDVSFVVDEGPATISGKTVTLTGETGIVYIRAKQSGDYTTYGPADDVIRRFYVGDEQAANVSPSSQIYTDDWVATDALGRTLPTYDEVGDTRDEKYIGVFYYIWEGFHGNTVYSIPEILKNYPSDPLSSSNTAWGPLYAFHFWGEPEYGYYRSEDPWVIRHDLQMLANAHVDFIYLDVTNSQLYINTVMELCKVSMEMRSEGIYTPAIVFTTHAYSGRVMNELYDYIYADDLFKDLWFMWDGKPLILGDKDDSVLRPEVKDFFTIKFSWAWSDTKNNPDHWQWVDTYPQDYGWNTNPDVPEQIAVATASHPNISLGKSYHNGEEPEVDSEYLTPYTAQGLCFKEQFDWALEVDPKVIMITQWNEWVAQRFIWDSGSSIFAGRSIVNGDSHFVDLFNQEFNRDIAPMKGGHTDNYYYQMLSYIRKFKGMEKPQSFSSPTTISIDGDFSEWADIQPLFHDPIGDVTHRDFPGYNPNDKLVNTSGRNDIIESRVIYDDDNLYFYVKTVDDITSYTDNNWMLLFIDADRKKGTGWEGYDFMINKAPSSSSQTSLQTYTPTGWGDATNLSYHVSGNEMEISVPRTALMMADSVPEFYFHWADNSLSLDDISAFFLDGESAPDRRFNFNFSTRSISTAQTPYKDMSIPGTIEMEDFDNGDGYRDLDISNTGGTYRTGESVDIKEKGTDEYFVTDMYTGEWLEYTVDVKAIGIFTATVYYATTIDSQRISLLIDSDTICKDLILPNTGSEDKWASISTDVRLSSGSHLLKVLVESANGGLLLDKIVFEEKNAVYPGDGTGLFMSLFEGSVGGRTWFVDSICGSVDSIVYHNWKANESPGCNLRSTFWNARWEGYLEPLFTDLYTISITADDLTRVYLDNELIIDAWTTNDAGLTHSTSVELKAYEKVPIQIDYANKTDEGSVKLEWESENQAREVIPQPQLYPKDADVTGINETTSKTHVLIYPNPASEQLSVMIDRDEFTIVVSNLEGKVIMEIKNEKKIDISNLKSGFYLVKVCYDKGEKTLKLIVK